LVLLATSSTTGSAPRASSASKPGGITSTGSPSLLSFSCCSKSAGAARSV